MTYLNGLPDHEMRLYVTALDDGGTQMFAQAPLEGSARVIGWNLYLTERKLVIRESVARAVSKIELADGV